MHFLGGLWVGIVSIWFFFFSQFAGKFTLRIEMRNILIVSIASVVIIGVLWEIFEIYAGVPRFTADYQLDTFADIIMDIFGAVAASLYTSKYTKQKTNLI